MYLVNREGKRVLYKPEILETYLVEHCKAGNLRSTINPKQIVQYLEENKRITDGMTTEELHTCLLSHVVQQITLHPDYDRLASRLVVDDLHSKTTDSFATAMRKSNAILQEALLFIEKYQTIIQKQFGHFESDYNLSYFGLLQLKAKYLILDITGTPLERPAHMFMRVAIQVHWKSILEHSDASLLLPSIFNVFYALANKECTFASPILMNALRPNAGLASCFLLSNATDSIQGMYEEVLPALAKISKQSGGIGISLGSFRAKGQTIRSTGGKSSGLVKFIRVINSVVQHIDQGGGKRKGACAIYMPLFHADALDIIRMKLPTTAEEQRAEDLQYALMIPDLFYKRFQEDGVWSMFSPDSAPGLDDCYGETFNQLYSKYESDPTRIIRQLKARDVMRLICEIQVTTGVPYILNRDVINQTSNQKNIGVIRCSNLCAEITEVSNQSSGETAVCNLASISLPACIEYDQKTNKPSFSPNKLALIVRVLTDALDRIIDANAYPTEEARASNMNQRPIGIGIQGLYDFMCILGIPFDSDEAVKLNAEICEVMYYSFLDASCDLVRIANRKPYPTFQGSDLSKGVFHWEHFPNQLVQLSSLDWEALRKRIVQYGVRNSLGIALMPTASTSSLLGNYESFEPPMGHLMTRHTDSGVYVIANHYLVKALEDIGIQWDETLRTALTLFRGRIHLISRIPKSIRDRFPTIWDIPAKRYLELAAARAPFVDQSQSLNCYHVNASLSSLTESQQSDFMYTYMAKYLLEARAMFLKTAAYYTRILPSNSNANFSASSSIAQQLLLEAKQELKQHSSSNTLSEKQTHTSTTSIHNSSDMIQHAFTLLQNTETLEQTNCTACSC